MKNQIRPLWLRYLPITTVVSGGLAGWLLFWFGNYFFIGATVKTLAVLIGSAWVGLMTFATKISDITESPSLTPDEHRRLEQKCKQAVRRVWTLSAANALAVILTLIPSAAVDAKSTLFEWTVVISGISGGFAIYSIAIQAWWQEELREFRSELRLREREEKRLADFKASFEKSAKNDNSTSIEEISKHNRSFDWPEEPPQKHH